MTTQLVKMIEGFRIILTMPARLSIDTIIRSTRSLCKVMSNPP